MASRTESLIWSAILSGCPSVTDSEVKSRPVTVWVLLVRRMVGVRESILQSPAPSVPNDVGQGGLGPKGYVAWRGVRGQDHGRVVGRPEHRSPADVVDDEEVTALAG